MCELVISCCDASEVFQPAKAPFDNIATLVDFFVVADFLFAVALARNDRLDAAFPVESTVSFRVVTLVGEEIFDAGDRTDAFLRDIITGGLAHRDVKDPWSTPFVAIIMWILLLRSLFVSPIASKLVTLLRHWRSGRF